MKVGEKNLSEPPAMIIVVSAVVAIAVHSAAGLGYLAYLLWRDRHATWRPGDPLRGVPADISKVIRPRLSILTTARVERRVT